MTVVTRNLERLAELCPACRKHPLYVTRKPDAIGRLVKTCASRGVPDGEGCQFVQFYTPDNDDQEATKRAHFIAPTKPMDGTVTILEAARAFPSPVRMPTFRIPVDLTPGPRPTTILDVRAMATPGKPCPCCQQLVPALERRYCTRCGTPFEKAPKARGLSAICCPDHRSTRAAK